MERAGRAAARCAGLGKDFVKSYFFVGLDLGQSHDYTAITVLERREVAGEWDPVRVAYRKEIHMLVRQAVRLPLGTTYPAIAQKVCDAVERLLCDGSVRLAVDATGVGRAVTDLLKQSGLAAYLWPVTVTGGEQEHVHNGVFSVPKKDLMAGVKVMLEQRALRISSRVREREALMKEFQEFGVRKGSHDDLLFALALSCWAARRVYPYAPTGDAAFMRWQLK